MLTSDAIAALFTRDDRFLCARWGRAVAPVAFGLAVAIGRLPAVAWTIGLGPTPWAARKARPQPGAVPA